MLVIYSKDGALNEVFRDGTRSRRPRVNDFEATFRCDRRLDYYVPEPFSNDIYEYYAHP